MWRWDEALKRYRNEAGRFLPFNFVRNLVEQSLASSTNATTTLLDLFLGGQLSKKDLNATLKTELKYEWIRQYLLGKGGLSQMKPADWGRLGGYLKDKYKRLQETLTREAAPEQLRQYLKAHAEEGRLMFKRAVGTVAKTIADEVLWKLNPLAEHCEDCLRRAALSWQPIGVQGGFPSGSGEVFPGDGSSICNVGDKCYLIYRNSETGKEWEL